MANSGLLGTGLSECLLDGNIGEHTGPTTDPSDQRVPGTGFQPVSTVLGRLVQQIGEATIRWAEAEGDMARAARLRAAYREIWERRDAA